MSKRRESLVVQGILWAALLLAMGAITWAIFTQRPKALSKTTFDNRFHYNVFNPSEGRIGNTLWI